MTSTQIAPRSRLQTQGPPEFRWLTGFFQAITWRTFAYHFIALFLATVGFSYVVAAISIGSSLIVTVIGLVVFAALIFGANLMARPARHLANSLLGAQIETPAPRPRSTGLVAYTKAGLTDERGWRAILFFGFYFINSILAFVTTITIFAIGLGGVTYNLWYRFLPQQQAADGSWHRGANFGPGYFLDTPLRVLMTSIVSAVILLFVWPVVNVKLGAIQASWSRALLGPTEQSRKVAQLRRSQAATVSGTDTQLRSIERDLHDVTQAQLVAIAMKLSDAKDRLAAQENPSEIAQILDSAHATSKAALTDLRGLVQGIHPAILNSGLETALTTLTATSAIPTTLNTNVTAVLSPSIEAVAYYCAAELLTNVAKHSGAQAAQLQARTTHDRLYLTVTDQGVGGAQLGHGTGLTGLAQRIGAVEGTLHINSPAGGPTVIIVELPTTLDIG